MTAQRSGISSRRRFACGGYPGHFFGVSCGLTRTRNHLVGTSNHSLTVPVVPVLRGRELSGARQSSHCVSAMEFLPLGARRQAFASSNGAITPNRKHRALDRRKGRAERTSTLL